MFIDTGFSRLGLDEAEVQTLASDPHRLITGRRARREPSACGTEHLMNRAQLEKFRFAPICFDALASLANSGGVFLGSDYCFDMTRIGISLYGLAVRVKQPRKRCDIASAGFVNTHA